MSWILHILRCWSFFLPKKNIYCDPALAAIIGQSNLYDENESTFKQNRAPTNHTSAPCEYLTVKEQGVASRSPDLNALRLFSVRPPKYSATIVKRFASINSQRMYQITPHLLENVRCRFEQMKTWALFFKIR